MIQLFIGSYEIVLPDDFSLTMVDENPIITKSGFFSMDIDVSLLEKSNAKALGFAGRLNKKTLIKDFSACMIIDNNVKNGRFIILSNTDISVKGQFVAGNSELNYLISGDKKIWELDWGTESELTYNIALNSLITEGYSPTNKFVCAPVVLGDIIANDFLLENVNNQYKINAIGEVIIMQPYLLYYIQKLPELLGYNLESNVLLNDNRAKQLYVVNSANTLNYSDALPDVTINEFITFIENYFNVKFICNLSTKNIKIENLTSVVSNAEKIKLFQAIDSFNLDFKETANTFNPNIFKYETPDCPYFKYQKLDNEIFGKVSFLEFDNINLLKTYAQTIPADHLTICKDKETSYYYITYIVQQTHQPQITPYLIFNEINSLLLVNKFSDNIQPTVNDISNELSFKICPAEMVLQNKLIPITTPFNQTLVAYYQLPKSSNSYYIKEKQGIVETIENSTKDINRLQFIEVSMYMGKIKFADTALTPNIMPYDVYYPFSYVDFTPEFRFENASLSKYAAWRDNVYFPKAINTLRLNGENNVVANYWNEDLIDNSFMYKFPFIKSSYASVNKTYEHENQNYLPIKFEYTYSQQKQLIVGYFYRLK